MNELARLLDALELFVGRFVVLDEAQLTAVALWVAHTWAIDAAQATPYLYVTSAEPECGKTRLLEVAAEVVRDPLSTVNISDAALYRAIDARRPTLFLDEVDAVFNPKARERGAKDDYRAILNAGYRRGQVVYRMGGGNHTTLEAFHVFGAKALAGLGSLPHTLASRAVRIELRRRRPDEPVEDFYPDELDQADDLRAWLSSWAEYEAETLRAARPARIEGLRDRVNEVWRPLLAIAELAGPAWAARARRAAVALSSDDSDDEASLGVLLLSDIRSVFDDPERPRERIATADLIRELGQVSESPWGEWWLDKMTDEPTRAAARRLAQYLRPYGIRSRSVRVDETTAKGYRREEFLDAWERYLSAPGVYASQGSHPSQPAPHGQTDVTDVTDVTHTRGGQNSRFCAECTTHDRCDATGSCAEIERLAALARAAKNEEP